jgi:pimeloyl-ACP methyl ester carboxylesterase
MTNRLETFTIAGLTHFVLVRGKADGPVLLLVQAGPGFPMIHEADALQRALGLEAEFRVAYWDQRGTGRSVDPATSPLTIAHLTTDLGALVEALTARLQVPAVSVMGFSLGGTLAILATELTRRISRVVAVGPDIDLAGSEAFAWAFAQEQAVRRGHRRALAQLLAIGPPPHDTTERFMTRVRWVTEFGGIHVGRTFTQLAGTLAMRLLTSPHYSLPQAFVALRAMQRTQARVLLGLSDLAMPGRITVPLTVIQGRLDVAAPPAFAQRWVDSLEAPRGKSLVWLDRCAHTPHYEDPPAFRAAVAPALASVAQSLPAAQRMTSGKFEATSSTEADRPRTSNTSASGSA